MLVSQRHEADSLDSTVFSEWKEESASVSELAVPEQQFDCWSVSSEYDEEIVSKNIFCMLKVKLGGRARAMSTPWCWKAGGVDDHEISPKNVFWVTECDAA